MTELSKNNPELFNARKIVQYTSWELEIMSIARDYADKYIET